MQQKNKKKNELKCCKCSNTKMNTYAFFLLDSLSVLGVLQSHCLLEREYSSMSFIETIVRYCAKFVQGKYYILIGLNNEIRRQTNDVIIDMCPCY